MKVRILKRPEGILDGMSLKRYVPGEVYDVSASVADYLVLQGYAVAEMRGGSRKQVHLKRKPDRRTRG